jgi:hypothetical protein
MLPVFIFIGWQHLIFKIKKLFKNINKLSLRAGIHGACAAKQTRRVHLHATSLLRRSSSQ